MKKTNKNVQRKTKETKKTITKKPMEVEYEGRILDVSPNEMREKAYALGGHMKAPLTISTDFYHRLHVISDNLS
jgi:hypothetical protein